VAAGRPLLTPMEQVLGIGGFFDARKEGVCAEGVLQQQLLPEHSAEEPSRPEEHAPLQLD